MTCIIFRIAELTLMRRYLHVTEFLRYIVTSIVRLVVGGFIAGVALVLLAFLMSLFLPDTKLKNPPGQRCISNLKQLGLAVSMYVQDYDETYPTHDEQHLDWGTGPWSERGEETANFRSTSHWIPLLMPYVKGDRDYMKRVFSCPSDVDQKRNRTAFSAPGSETPFPVSYGPNRMFVNPTAYGWKKRAVSMSSVVHPESKYLLADCVTAHGFDLKSIAYVRYPDYHPSRRQNGWTEEQFRSMGRAARSDQVAAPVTRHDLATTIAFADGHVKQLRHNEIPDNDGPGGPGYRALTKALVPWQ
jgi:prepilin-type processing-associated H-X9-DG protein